MPKLFWILAAIGYLVVCFIVINNYIYWLRKRKDERYIKLFNKLLAGLSKK
jgi:hypothetical protein